MTVSLGSRLGPYEITKRLGAGGMGEVYQALDTRLGRTVAIKVLPPEFAGDPERRRRFEQEARAASALNHPHICALYDIGREGDTDFLVMEYVEGETLAERVRRGPLPVAEVEQLGLQLADALGAAHDRGLIHRDIKPSNLMVTPDGALKILDFGLATRRAPVSDQATTQLAGESWARTAPGVLMGSPAYMAPEQISGDPVSSATDVYGAGCVLYELLAGRPPFAGHSLVDLLRRSLTEAARPLTDVRPDVPAALSAAIVRALSRDPRDRYANGRELGRALREHAFQMMPDGLGQPPGGVAQEVHSTATPAQGLSPAIHRTRLFRFAGAAAAIVALAALTWFAVSRFTEPALAFNARDFILVADVVNRTGEPVFDLALKSALETDLRQSRYVNVLDSSQVRNTLLLMRQKPDTPVTEAVGRDLCRRTGARALLLPRMLKAGEAYQIMVSLIEPSTGRVAADVEVTARGREQVLLSAIDRVTRDVRSRLGESLSSIAQSDPPFAQYTTSSPEAIQLLELGNRAREAGDAAKAERAFKGAIERDPHFAAARGSLGLMYMNLNREDEGRTLLAQALQEEGTLSQREHLLARAVYKQFAVGDLQGALDDYRFITDLYPDFASPYNNSGLILTRLGRYREAARMFERAMKADPRFLLPSWNLWFLSTQRLKDPALAEREARKLGQLLPDSPHAQHLLAWTFVAQRRFREAEDRMRAVLELDPVHAYALPNLGYLLYRRGAWGEAVAAFRRVVAERAAGRLAGDTDADLYLGLGLEASGAGAEARRTLEKAMETMRLRGRKTPLAPSAQALMAAMLAAQGRRDEARVLAGRVARAPADSTGETSYALAQAWSVLGDRAQAIRCLEQAFASGFTDTYFILIDPALSALQDDPAIERLAPRRPNS